MFFNYHITATLTSFVEHFALQCLPESFKIRLLVNIALIEVNEFCHLKD